MGPVRSAEHEVWRTSVQHLYARCCTWLMATTRPRVFVTETDELTRALDDAARRWPGESRCVARAAGLGQLAGLRVASGLTMPDCCVRLAAIASKGAVAAFDSRLASVATSWDIRTLTSGRVVA